MTVRLLETTPILSPTPTQLPEIEEEPKELANRLVETNNELRRADAASEDGACRAVRKNGVKNCRLGVRMVGGLKRYCSNPVDC